MQIIASKIQQKSILKFELLLKTNFRKCHQGLFLGVNKYFCYLIFIYKIMQEDVWDLRFFNREWSEKDEVLEENKKLGKTKKKIQCYNNEKWTCKTIGTWWTKTKLFKNRHHVLIFSASTCVILQKYHITEGKYSQGSSTDFSHSLSRPKALFIMNTRALPWLTWNPFF